MKKYIVLWVNGGRVGSRPLAEKNLLESLVRYRVLQVDKSGTEHWDVLRLRRKGERLTGRSR